MNSFYLRLIDMIRSLPLPVLWRVVAELIESLENYGLGAKHE
jgi:hypothetical protein